MSKDGEKGGFVSDSLEKQIEETVPGVKKESGGSSAGVLDTFWNCVESVKGGFSTVADGVGKALSTLGEWKDEGTPLRSAFKSARLELEDAGTKARERTARRQAAMKERMEKMNEKRKKRLQALDESGALTKCAELKKQHPELVVGGFTLAVALPSAFGGGRAVLRNGGKALVLSSAVVYGGAWMKRRGLTLPQIRRRDDSQDGVAET